MLPLSPFAIFTASQALALVALPAQQYTVSVSKGRYFDVQAHRGGRGNTVENTLPSFAWGLIDGASTLELDNGITKDGVVVVWHDENITPEKCIDTAPAMPNDPDFPYVGKFVANLTLAQLRTLDCGSKRQEKYPLQLTYPGTRISTLEEVFAFAECADPSHEILWNIESKINAQFPNQTLGVNDFVQKQHAIFSATPYRKSITYQSFDWRTLVEMKKLDPSVITSALIDSATATGPGNTSTPWLAGLDLSVFPGPTLDMQVAQAARYIHANILSPAAVHDDSPVLDPSIESFVPFTTKAMIDEAHGLGVEVKPWTINRLNIVDQLLDWDVDGIISDYPNAVRRLVKQRGLPAAPKYPKQRVLTCLNKHLAKQQPSS
ncbi:PLC-like phosphodiesterase [Irpex rosettiformis]|uniref:PLC-like phosphodiesterase n=1 Tax=Irpex rosettiformis TaxID=378272 RepID=A0ACB8TUE5_9APHY|nr:PLC-like phosphodiesterase [Irpex rosettiformis]